MSLSIRSTSRAARVGIPSASSSRLSAWRYTEFLDETPWTRTYRACPQAIDALPDEGAFAVVVTRDDLPGTFDRELAHGLLVREAEVSQQIQHSHLATTLSIQREADCIYLVQPYAQGKPLAELAQSVPTPARLWTIRQSAEALIALHRAGWLHGDVTPRSIFADPSGHATLTQLGFARRLGSEECDVALTRFAGSLRYAAPEMFDDQSQLTAAADIYSLGAVLWEQLSGEQFLGKYQGPELIAAKRLLSRANEPGLGQLAPIVSQMLAREPLRRPPAKAVVEALVATEVEMFGRWAA
jgi:serine/threonine protein kinase